MSKIEWTGQTWNPIVGCAIVSPGCKNCYAMRTAHRLGCNPATPIYNGLTRVVNGHPVWTGEMRLHEAALDIPLRRKTPTTWFVNSMSDLFAEGVDELWGLDRIFAIMALTPRHTYQVLTKRPERMLAYLDAAHERVAATALVNALRGTGTRDPETLRHGMEWPLANVWIGASVEDQPRADERRSPLATLAATGWTTFVSYEPALGLVDWTGWEFLKWLISGGESGQRARPSHPDWHRAARDFCARHKIPFFFKQWGEWLGDFVENDSPAILKAARPIQMGSTNKLHIFPDAVPAIHVGKKSAGRTLDGVIHDAMPRPA